LTKEQAGKERLEVFLATIITLAVRLLRKRTANALGYSSL